jgi:hypothetical protein
MCHDITCFIPSSLTTVNYTIKLGDNSEISSNRAGTAYFNKIPLHALYVPEFRLSLISVSQLDKDGCKCIFFEGKVTVTNHTHRPLFIAYEEKGIYRIDTD